mgnify:CR=1 FL=1
MMSELLWDSKLNQWVDYRINEARSAKSNLFRLCKNSTCWELVIHTQRVIDRLITDKTWLSDLVRVLMGLRAFESCAASDFID